MGAGDGFGAIDVEVGDAGEFEVGAEFTAGDAGGVAAAHGAGADDCDAHRCLLVVA